MLRKITCGLFFLLSMALHAEDDFERHQIQERIRPVGQVHLEDAGEPTRAEQDSSQSSPMVNKKSIGQATYEQYCVVCHRDGVAGAPKFRNASDWKPRKAKQTVDGLVATATKGLNAMPPKGACQECSPADLKAAIEYMLPPP
jgi:cytochrome c5